MSLESWVYSMISYHHWPESYSRLQSPTPLLSWRVLFPRPPIPRSVTVIPIKSDQSSITILTIISNMLGHPPPYISEPANQTFCLAPRCTSDSQIVRPLFATHLRIKQSVCLHLRLLRLRLRLRLFSPSRPSIPSILSKYPSLNALPQTLPNTLLYHDTIPYQYQYPTIPYLAYHSSSTHHSPHLTSPPYLLSSLPHLALPLHFRSHKPSLLLRQLLAVLQSTADWNLARLSHGTVFAVCRKSNVSATVVCWSQNKPPWVNVFPLSEIGISIMPSCPPLLHSALLSHCLTASPLISHRLPAYCKSYSEVETVQ